MCCAHVPRFIMCFDGRLHLRTLTFTLPSHPYARMLLCCPRLIHPIPPRPSNGHRSSRHRRPTSRTAVSPAIPTAPVASPVCFSAGLATRVAGSSPRSQSPTARVPRAIFGRMHPHRAKLGGPHPGRGASRTLGRYGGQASSSRTNGRRLRWLSSRLEGRSRRSFSSADWMRSSASCTTTYG